eukprot:9499313-Pyramimonas_sp.AAC.2
MGPQLVINGIVDDVRAVITDRPARPRPSSRRRGRRRRRRLALGRRPFNGKTAWKMRRFMRRALPARSAAPMVGRRTLALLGSSWAQVHRVSSSWAWVRERADGSDAWPSSPLRDCRAAGGLEAVLHELQPPVHWSARLDARVHALLRLEKVIINIRLQEYLPR